MTDKLIEALERIASVQESWNGARFAKQIASESLAAHRSQQSPPAAKGVEPPPSSFWVWIAQQHQDALDARSGSPCGALTRQIVADAIGKVHVDFLNTFGTSPAPSESEAKDAARYRFLRSLELQMAPNFEYRSGLCVDLWDEDGCGSQVSGDELDAAVDVALSASGKGKSDES